ncbi:MAG: iron-only hydrogenase system regulator [Clostridia bacterium]|nr:iron-only hydrogenase system regulator [Clostridia bacterium]
MEEEKRIAILSILVENRGEAETLNAYLSEYGEYIVGRMGIPYREKHVSVLAVALDAPVSVTNALTGKIGKLAGVSAKTLFSKI